jgi:hypothetical protein
MHFIEIVYTLSLSTTIFDIYLHFYTFRWLLFSGVTLYLQCTNALIYLLIAVSQQKVPQGRPAGIRTGETETGVLIIKLRHTPYNI